MEVTSTAKKHFETSKKLQHKRSSLEVFAASRLYSVQPPEYGRQFTHEVLAIMKNENNPVAKKQLAEINEYLPINVEMDEILFNDLYKLSKQITDFDQDEDPDTVARSAPDIPIVMYDETENKKGLDREIDFSAVGKEVNLN